MELKAPYSSFGEKDCPSQTYLLKYKAKTGSEMVPYFFRLSKMGMAPDKFMLG